MVEIKLPFWLSAAETAKLVAAAKTWWQRAEDWVRWPLGQTDALTCELGILDLLAWQRDITRFEDEPEALYRNRVKFAQINAEDSGSKAGFIRIFERLGIGYLEIDERTDPVNWDVITLTLSDSQLAQNPALLTNIINQYGRTCRRYTLQVLTPIPGQIEARDTGHSWNLNVASL
jgi:hypothetical protein